MIYSSFHSNAIPFRHFLKAWCPLFPHLSVAGYVVKAANSPLPPQENQREFSAMDCTSVYKEKVFKHHRHWLSNGNIDDHQNFL